MPCLPAGVSPHSGPAEKPQYTVTAGGVVVTAPLTLEGQGWRVVWESQSLEGMGLAVTMRGGCLGCHQLSWDIFISLLGPKAWE